MSEKLNPEQLKSPVEADEQALRQWAVERAMANGGPRPVCDVIIHAKKFIAFVKGED